MANADEKELRLMHAELCDASGNLPTLDLHGMKKEDAIEEMKQFLSHQIFSGESCCCIVHGRGSGILERAVKKEMKDLVKSGKIESFFPSQRHPSAAVVVVLAG